MKYVNFLFHIYQPPNQDFDILTRVVEQSYSPLLRQIEEFGDLRFTLNINFSLVELLSSAFPNLLEKIGRLYERGNLELTATAAYHPILPLIPVSEVTRQLKINRDGNRRLLSHSFDPEGVFPPELAFSGHLVPLFRSLGYKWTVADDGLFRTSPTAPTYDRVFSFEGFAVFLRSNLWANKFANYDGLWKHGREFVAELIASMTSWMVSVREIRAE